MYWPPSGAAGADKADDVDAAGRGQGARCCKEATKSRHSEGVSNSPALMALLLSAIRVMMTRAGVVIREP
jgi:hypothetical protein